MAYPTNWPTTLTDLANRIMRLIGEKQQFTDITTDTTDNGGFVRDVLYDTIRDTQSAFPWPELHTMETISTPDATFTDTTGYRYSYRFALPDDFLRPINEDIYEYEIIGAFVYTNVSSDLDFHYIKYDETITNWSAALYRAVIYRAGMTVCVQITQAPEVHARLLREYEAVVEPECYRVRSYNQRHPNTRQAGNGSLAVSRRGQTTTIERFLR